MAHIMPEHLGPLAPLAGIWEGSRGDDIAPSDDRGIENNKFRERLTFEPFGPIDNHEQKLYGLRYSTMAWRHAETDHFHEECGYWLWDAAENQVMRCFVVPRGVALIAGGTVLPDARSFVLSARAGATGYGINSNLFLDREFRTIGYELKVTLHDDDSFTYEEDTILRLKGSGQDFHHTDKNQLFRVG